MSVLKAYAKLLALAVLQRLPPRLVRRLIPRWLARRLWPSHPQALAALRANFDAGLAPDEPRP